MGDMKGQLPQASKDKEIQVPKTSKTKILVDINLSILEGDVSKYFRGSHDFITKTSQQSYVNSLEGNGRCRKAKNSGAAKNSSRNQHMHFKE